MMGLPSIKTMGIGAVIMAILAFFFKDAFGGIFSSFFGQEAQAGEAPAPAATSGAQGEKAAPAVQISAAERAANVMAEWKPVLETANMPEPARQAILAREKELVVEFQKKIEANAPDEKKIQEALIAVKMAEFSAVAKPQFDAFVNQAQKQVSDEMDKMIRAVSQNSNLPQKAKDDAVKGLEAQKKTFLSEVKGDLEKAYEKKSPQQRIEFALSLETQEKILGGHLATLNSYKEAIEKDVSAIAREHNGLSWGSHVLGWGSFALGATGLAIGIAASATGVGAVGGVPLAAASSALMAGALATGVGAGVCKVVNHSGKGGNTVEWTVGLVEIAAGGLPLARTGVGLASNAMKVGTVAAKEAGAISQASGTVASMFTKTGREGFSLVAGEALAGTKLAAASDVGKELLTRGANSTVARNALAEAIEAAGGNAFTKLASGGRKATELLVESAEQAVIKAGGNEATQKLAKIAAQEFATHGSLAMSNQMTRVTVAETITDVTKGVAGVVPNATPPKSIDAKTSAKLTLPL